MMGKQYVEFKVAGKKPKTTIYHVVSKSDGFILGVIKWDAPWRQYCFFPAERTTWSRGCLEQVVDFIHNLMEARKKPAKKDFNQKIEDVCNLGRKMRKVYIRRIHIL